MLAQDIFAQEQVIPLSSNIVYHTAKKPSSAVKKTRATLPFIDDFAYEGPFPDPSLWTDNKVFINNTMSAEPITRGVATFDGLNEFGRPYFPESFTTGMADSLTSVSLNLSGYTDLDHIYMSFYYQPQGLGFAPENGDSLFLFFKNSANQWVRAWQARGTPYQGFKIVLLPIEDAQFLHNDFQFRFVNIASLNINDDVWNIDYVKIDVNRNIDDTVMNDIGFSVEPSSILKNYTSMPYRHFSINQANEKSVEQKITIGNLYAIPHFLGTKLQVNESISSTSIHSNNLPTVPIGAKIYLQQSFASYPITYTPPLSTSKVQLRNTYFYSPVNATDNTRNDTISRETIFDNYFAYDDGSAEKSYFLLAATNFAAKTALQFTLNQTDTIRGLMVHFGPQAPTALGKFFSIVLYQSLGAGVIQDSIILQEDLFKVQYEPSYNGFSSYAFAAPKVLTAGTYYIGITQPANFGSDSIYYGLDVNTNTSAQHLAYNVDGTWYSSAIAGSLMMRPIVGQAFIATGLPIKPKETPLDCILFPNPVHHQIFLTSDEQFVSYTLFQMDGTVIATASMDHNQVDVEHLNPGNYLIVFRNKKGQTISKKIYKK